MESTREKRRSRNYRIIAIVVSLAIHLSLGWYLYGVEGDSIPDEQGPAVTTANLLSDSK